MRTKKGKTKTTCRIRHRSSWSKCKTQANQTLKTCDRCWFRGSLAFRETIRVKDQTEILIKRTSTRQTRLWCWISSNRSRHSKSKDKCPLRRELSRQSWLIKLLRWQDRSQELLRQTIIAINHSSHSNSLIRITDNNSIQIMNNKIPIANAHLRSLSSNRAKDPHWSKVETKISRRRTKMIKSRRDKL